MTEKKLIVYLAADSWGFSLHQAVLNHLEQKYQKDVTLVDCGVYTKYYQAAHRVGLEVEKAAIDTEIINDTEEEPVRGILICGSGQGVAIIANKFKHVYAALCTTPEQAQGCRAVNNSNVLTMGARITDEETALAIVDAWLATQFGEGLAPHLADFIRHSMPEIESLEFTHDTEQSFEADAVPTPAEEADKGNN